MKSEEQLINYITGYCIGEKIRKTGESSLALLIMVILWIVPLWIFDILGIGY